MTVPPVRGPYLSVIVPSHDSARTLATCLDAIVRSDLPRDCWELIVVDDASADDSALIAAEYADTVISLPGNQRGPAYARNRGFEVSRGEGVVFVNPDARVNSDTLRRIALVFAHEPDVSAVFGSYDTRSPAVGVVSTYRNLLHHYVHLQSAGDAETFWAVCGAVRREVFLEAGMYDEWRFARPQVEDMELGQRIRARGHKIVLRPEISVTNLTEWTFREAIHSDLRDRGVPWMRLLMGQRASQDSDRIALKTVERTNTGFVWAALIFSLVAMIAWDARWLIATAVSIQAILFVNRHLYSFFERERGLLFTVRAIPMHLIYYVVFGVAMAVGWCLHVLVGDSRPAPLVEAYAEVGLKTWPPVPTKQTALAQRSPATTS
jgi:glycosyltransferase involved in cell wall biosynthesis